MTEENKNKSRATNRALGKARAAKNDEFYTRRESIEEELWHYRQHFAGKVVYCNCDDPRVSEFYRYFKNNFSFSRLKKLLTTCYKSRNPDMFSRHDSERAVFIEYGGGDSEVRDFLQSDGDFRSPECIDLLRQADVVVTNPPFSLFREYIAQLIAENKKFLVIGNKNAIHYKEIFSLIMAGELWVGYTPMGADMLFDVPPEFAEWLKENKKEGSSYKIVDGVVKGRAPAIWFTNLDHKKRHEEFIRFQPSKYGDGSAYPKYDNYDAIEVSKVKYIPRDYAGVMGVPDTFLDKWNPDEFEILGMLGNGKINGVAKYSRILIKRKGA